MHPWVICPIPSISSFVQAQAPVCDTVLAELRAGRKRTHPIWFVSAAHRAGRAVRWRCGTGQGRFEVIFDDITSGPRAQSRAHRGVPDDELHEWRTAALLGGGDAAPVVDTELVEPEPGRTDLPPRSNAERTTNARRRDIRSQRFRVLGVGENVVVGTPKL